MSIVDFDHLKITTMTVVMNLSGQVDLNVVFPLLYITRVELPSGVRRTKKTKIPYCDIPGAILSARYNNVTRGIIRSGSFLNSITIDIGTSVKNVSLKLSKNKIQMCGTTSIEVANEAAEHIIRHLYQIQETLDLINSDKEASKTMVEWVISNTKGDATIIDGRIIRRIVAPPPYPETFNSAIMDFFYDQADNFVSHDDYQLQLEWILTLTNAITPPIKVTNLHKVMVNYNFHLGFNVNRRALADRIYGRNGFYSRYDNSVDHCVTIELPYELEEHHNTPRKKDKIPRHTFLVYKSGLVTQSGPNEVLMKDVYNLFNATINEIRSDVERTGVIRGLRYRPCYQDVSE